MYIIAKYIQMLVIFGITCRERREEKIYYNTATLATVFSTFQFNIDGAGVMTVKRQVTRHFPAE